MTGKLNRLSRRLPVPSRGATLFIAGLLAGLLLSHISIQNAALRYESITPETVDRRPEKPPLYSLFPKRVRRLDRRILELNHRIATLKRREENHVNSIKLWNRTGNTLLKRLVERDYPQLQDPELDDWTKVNLLRQWAYENVDWGVQSTLINTDPRVNYFSLPAPAIFATFYRDAGGTFCGGTSFALRKLYQLFGYDAFSYGMGRPEAQMHAVTLVRIQHRGRERLCVQDAAFNLTFVDPGGEPFDFFEMLEALKNHRHDRVRVQETAGRLREVIYSRAGELGPVREKLQPVFEGAPVATSLTNGKYKSRVTIDVATFDASYSDQINGFLKSEGHPPGSIYLYLYPISIDGSRGDERLFERAQAIVGNRPRQPAVAHKPGGERE